MDHVETQGRALFDRICQLDLEGIVAKRKQSLYRPTDKPSRYWGSRPRTQRIAGGVRPHLLLLQRVLDGLI